MTRFHAFFNDPRIQQAIDLIHQALKEHQRAIQGLQPATPELQSHYQGLLDRMKTARGTKLWYPFLGSGLGNGPWVELADGSIKFDAIGGIGCHLFGHSHPQIIESSLRAALEDTVMQGNLQQNTITLEVLEKLLQLSKMDHAFLSTSGAMACENALKIAFHHKPGAQRVLAFEHCFMGRTLALSQITDKAAYRTGLPCCLHVDYLPYFDPEQPEKSTKQCLERLDQLIARYPQDYAALTVELVQGEGGIRSGEHNFFAQIFERAKKHSIAIIVDEVQTFLRTSCPFAYQHFDLGSYVDIVTLGKASQLCATLFRGQFNPKPGLLSQTYTASTSSLYAFLTVIKLMEEGGYFGQTGKNMQIHHRVIQRLEAIAQQYPGWIKGPYGVGSMIAFTPFDGSDRAAQLFSQALFDEGVICFLAGDQPKRARFLLPALALELSHLDILTQCIEKALATCEKALKIS